MYKIPEEEAIDFDFGYIYEGKGQFDGNWRSSSIEAT